MALDLMPPEVSMLLQLHALNDLHRTETLLQTRLFDPLLQKLDDHRHRDGHGGRADGDRDGLHSVGSKLTGMPQLTFLDIKDRRQDQTV